MRWQTTSRRALQNGVGVLGDRAKESGEFIGLVGLHIPSPAIPYSPCVEVGWRLAHQYWGHGYATEAARSALQVGFEVLDLNEIFAFTYIRNLRSRAVMDRLGMVEEPETFEHPNVPEGNRVRKHCAYRIAKDAWEASAA